MPLACASSSWTVERRNSARRPRRFGSPTTTRVTFRVRAYCSSAEAAVGPSSVTASAPSDSARRSTSIRLFLSASPRRSRGGVSTATTIHSASSASAKRLPNRTSSSAWSSGPTPMRNRSRASQGREPRSRPAYSRAAASTRSAVWRSASSRRASRFGLRKNRSRAAPTCSGTYTLPVLSRSSRSSGGRSISSISDASSSTRSGTVSCCRTPVIAAITSFRLSTCWTLSVVQTSSPAASISSMSCQRFAWRGGGSPSMRLVWASSSTTVIAARRRSAASRSNSRRVTPR